MICHRCCNNTWLRGDVKFLFECWTRCLNEWVHFWLFSKEFPNVVRRSCEHFTNFSEDYRCLPMIYEKDSKMFQLNIDKLRLIQHFNEENSSTNMTSSISDASFYMHSMTIFLSGENRVSPCVAHNNSHFDFILYYNSKIFLRGRGVLMHSTTTTTKWKHWQRYSCLLLCIHRLN